MIKVVQDNDDWAEVSNGSMHGDEPVPLELTMATLYVSISDRVTNKGTALFYKREVSEVLQNYLGGVFFHSTLYNTTAIPDYGVDVNGEGVFTYRVNAIRDGDFEKMCNELREGGFSER